MSKQFNKTLNVSYNSKVIINTSGNFVSNASSNTLGNIFTTGGNVGINRVSPDATLDVNGTIKTTNLNFTGNLLQNGNPYISSQWTTVSASGLTYTAGNVGIGVVSPNLPTATLDVVGTGKFTNLNVTGNSTIQNVALTNMISTNSSIGVLNATGLTAGNINFTGGLFQNGSVYISSQWSSVGASGTTGVLTYTGGNVGIGTSSPSFLLDVNGNARFGNITTGNINFTGSLFQNGSPYIGSQWATLTGIGIGYTGGNVGIGTSNPSFVLDVNGTARISNITTTNLITTNLTNASLRSTDTSISNLNATNITASTSVITNGRLTNTTISVLNVTGITAGNINFTGNLFQNGSLYISSQWSSVGTSGNLSYTGGNVGIGTTNPSYSLDVVGNVRITNGSLLASNFAVSAFTSATLVSSSLNLGITNNFSSTAVGANNTTNVISGLSFNSVNISSFVIVMNVSVVKSAGSNLYEIFTIEGVQNGSGWAIYTSSIGDITGITFAISSGGQISYTSPNISDWSSTTFRYSVSQISTNSSYTSSFVPETNSSYIIQNLQITNTEDSIAGVSNGGIYTLGGLTVQKSAVIYGSLYSNNITTGVILCSDVSTSNLNVTATNITNANIALITAGTILNTSLSSGSVVSSNLSSTNITSSNVIVSNNLTCPNVVSSNISTTNVSCSSIISGVSNASNTIGSIITTAGNVGVGTTAPSCTFDINGLLKTIGFVGLTTQFSSVRGINIPIDLSTYRTVEITINHVISGVNTEVYLVHNTSGNATSGTNFTDYRMQLMAPTGATFGNTDNFIYVGALATDASANNGFATIRLFKPHVASSRVGLDFRASYNRSTFGQCRVDGVGCVPGTVPTFIAFYTANASTTISGTYTIRNFV